jgi:SAM-dependent methyltransferase
VSLRDYPELWRLARARGRSEEDYRRFQAFQAGLIILYLERHGVELGGRRMLDLGSGFGGYSREFAGRGASVVSLDLVQPAGLLSPTVKPVRGSALELPFREQSFDIVFCASLIEHVPSPGRLLEEVERVLSPDGFAYVSFPPYWSPVGGHEFSPYHYLGERLAIRLARRRATPPEWVHRVQDRPAGPRSFESLYRGWGLYRMTIRRMRRLLTGTRWERLNLSTRYLPVSLVRWPLLGELFTWHAQFLLRKRA